MIVRATALVGLVALASCSTRPRPRADDVPSTRAPAQATPATEIAWESYETGLARARSENRPAILVYTATWCSQCQAYKSVLANPSVIALSQRFVMIQVDITEHPELNRMNAPDGTYVPRTMFVGADGSPRPELRSPSRTRYAYFLDPNDPSELLTLMQRALRAT